MNPRRIAIKIPAASGSVDAHHFIELFHRFIQQGSVEGLLIDVADYAHVPNGPSVLLVGDEVDYAIDETSGQAGLLTVRKRAGDQPIEELFADTLRKALVLLAAVDEDGRTGMRFDPATLRVQVFDRAVAGNSDADFESLEKKLGAAAEQVLGTCKLSRIGSDDERKALGIQVQPRVGVDVEAVIEKLGGRQLRPVPEVKQSDWDVTVEELKSLIDAGKSPRIVDVREPDEFDVCQIGGELIPLGTLGEKLDALPKEDHIVVHCKGGPRGAQAVKQLRKAGFENSWNLRGGILAWIDRIDPSLQKY